MSFKVPFIRPVFPDAEIIAADMRRIVKANWYTNFGPYERNFSNAVASFIGEEFHAATFANATLGLMAVISAGLGRGDKSRFILVPSFTFAAGPQAIDWCGYRPLFVDIEPDGLQPDLDSARRALSEHGKDVAGILLCNTFGIGNVSVDAWERLAEESGLEIFIDSAAGFGSAYADGSRVGRAGHCEVFSFHATKPFAVGEGGAVVSRDAEFIARLRSFQNFGFSPSGAGATVRGLNGKMQEVNAAIGLRQFEGFEAAISSRQLVASTYEAELAGSFFQFPAGMARSAVCFATARVPTHEIQVRVLGELREAGIEARSYYSPAVHDQEYFRDTISSGSLVETQRAVSTSISLPVHQQMDAGDVDLVISTLRKAAGLI
ncbi:DegT/DnrJ/EryC1/StrS family aminotransferase [Cryobacterium serini]|uniref:DegT/DnrJ/EryC1/StrS aminotransferase family protein n=1 Tax=Cryobacterium serini TaxID=1259201 RepID=A0A4R9BKV9_9MICO|nr:DegT/DnrJ/EryC1/StrS family aminotransferase [Cryobacterium serini]TFD86268.1 DegT/DnrJ/EryC1/StrS aminotransferase family protein [Cryobacterium serini]